MLTGKKGKHINFISDRMRELQNEICALAIHEESIPLAKIKRKRELLFKYRRRIKLLRT